jgi:hypothetical protein
MHIIAAIDYDYNIRHTHTHSYCVVHFQRMGSFAVQNAVISCVIDIFQPIIESTSHPWPPTFFSLPLTYYSPLLISVLVSCMAYPHYIYSGESTMLFLFRSVHDAIQATVIVSAILYL